MEYMEAKMQDLYFATEQQAAFDAGFIEGRRQMLWSMYWACLYLRDQGGDFLGNFHKIQDKEFRDRIRGMFTGYDTATYSMADECLMELERMGDTKAMDILKAKNEY